MNLLAELRRRNVFRVAAAYLIAGWVVLQVVELIAGATGLPEWTSAFALVLLIVGLPIALIVAWAFELTPEGPKRTEASGESETIKPFRPADAILMAGLVVMIGAIIWQQVSSPAPVQIVAEERITGQSIAVLPFVAISEAPEDVVLGDGLAEELLNVLAQFPDLMVAGRTSSFSFRDQAEDIPAIGEALGVAHVLEGSVRRSGNQIRVTAQLIRASDGIHVWSSAYDRPFEHILRVQDDIVRQIAQVLTIRLGVANVARVEPQNVNPAAYEQYLRGRYFWAERQNHDNRFEAINAFQTSVDIDPNFAAGWAALGRALMLSNPPENFTWTAHIARLQAAVERALELDPNSAEGLVALSGRYTYPPANWAEAKRLSERALELAPSAAYTHYHNALLNSYLGNADEMAASIRRTVSLDPLNYTVQLNSAASYALAGQHADARRLMQRSHFPELLMAEAEWALAYYAEDADRYARAIERVSVARPEQSPGEPAFTPEGENSVAAHLAAFRGDVAEVRERLPQVIADAERGELLQRDPGFLYYLIEDYASAARQFLEINSVPQGAGSFFVARHHFEPGLLCQPDYHALWERPGMPELAEIRRANGATGNLPLSGPECAPYLSGDPAGE